VQSLFNKLKQLPSDYTGMTIEFVNQILSMKRWYVQLKQEVDPALWNSRKWFQISERDWFKSANLCARGILEKGKKTPQSLPRGGKASVLNLPKQKTSRERKD
jgi:hypothetical protein